MAPTSRIFLVVLFFILGLALSYLYRSQCVRQHLRLLHKRDELKREWDTLNAGHMEHAGQLSAGLGAKAQTEFAHEDNDAAPTTEVEAMPAPGAPQALATPALDSEPDQLIVDEPISLSTEALPNTESTEPGASKIPVVDAPLPNLTVVISAFDSSAATDVSTYPVPAATNGLLEKMPLPGGAKETINAEVDAVPDATASTLKPLGAIAAATVATVATIGALQGKDNDETEAAQMPETTSTDGITGGESPVASPAPEITETAALGKDSAATEKESSVAVPQPAPAPLETKLSSSNAPQSNAPQSNAPQSNAPQSNTPSSERTTPLIVNVPPNADPLHLLTGLNPAAANALITLGITRFEQLFSMDDIELAQLANKHSSLEPLRWREVRDEVRIDARMRSNPVIPPSAATREKESSPRKPPASTVADVAKDEVTQPQAPP